MRIDQTTAGGAGQRNDEDYDIPTGIYTCRLREVADLPPKADDERKTPRLVFEFEVADGPYKGKRISTFVRKNLFAGGGARGAKPSSLYKLAKSLGVADPMAGFDTEQYVGHLYTIVAKNEGTRAWPDSILPFAGAAAASAPAPGGSAGGPPPRRPAAAPAVERFWVELNPDSDAVSMTRPQIEDHLARTKTDPGQLLVCPPHGTEWSPASAFGFRGPGAAASLYGEPAGAGLPD